MSAFPTLFSPIGIGTVTLRNRIVFGPHFTALGSEDGMPTAAHSVYYAARARGGAGLVVFESQAVHPLGKMAARFVHAWDETAVPAYRCITDAVHAEGAAIFGQLTHAGHTVLDHPPALMWAPTQMAPPHTAFNVKAMDADDVAALLDGFARAGRNAQAGGFDGIEVKIAHDGLLRSFASPFLNRRRDRYGGSLQNRLRLSLEALAAVRDAVADDLAIGVRLCLDEATPWGYGLDHGLAMAEHLEASGLVDYFNCDAGTFSSFWIEIPPAGVPVEGFRLYEQALKPRTSLPVVAFGRITTGEQAEAILAAGHADLVGMCRQLICDPDTPAKLARGDAALVRPCIACNDACTHQTGQGKPIRCVHNPACGRERALPPIAPTARARRIAVVGAGPAGLRAAVTLAQGGHRVVLFERDPEPGGLVRLASRQPHHETIRGVVDHLVAAAHHLRVDVRLGTEVDVGVMAGEGFDHVVVATGSAPALAQDLTGEDGAVALGLTLAPPVLHGAGDVPVLSIDDVLGGRADDPNGGRALVIDEVAHWETAGTAEYLAARGWEVVVAAPGGAIGANINAISRALFEQRTVRAGIRLEPSTTVVSVGGGVAVGRRDPGGIRVELGSVDVVVHGAPRRSRRALAVALRASLGRARVTEIGDCVAPRLLEGVILEAELAARALV